MARVSCVIFLWCFPNAMFTIPFTNHDWWCYSYNKPPLGIVYYIYIYIFILYYYDPTLPDNSSFSVIDTDYASHGRPFKKELDDQTKLFSVSLTKVMITCNSRKVRSMFWLVSGLEHFCCFHILGMSSSQLTNSIIFERGRSTTNHIYIYIIYRYYNHYYDI